MIDVQPATIARLALKPGDMVVLTVPQVISQEQAANARAQLEAVFLAQLTFAVRVMIITGGATLAVATAEEAAEQHGA